MQEGRQPRGLIPSSISVPSSLPLLLLLSQALMMTSHVSEAVIRNYFIAAEEVEWDFALGNKRNLLNPRDE